MRVGSNIKIKMFIILWFCNILTTYVHKFLMSLLIDRAALKVHVGKFSYVIHVLGIVF